MVKLESISRSLELDGVITSKDIDIGVKKIMKEIEKG